MKYTIATGSTVVHLESEVNKLLELGWYLHGEIVFNPNRQECHQVMTRGSVRGSKC